MEERRCMCLSTAVRRKLFATTLAIIAGCQMGFPGTVVAKDNNNGGLSTLCKFTAGPRTGQTQDYAPLAPLPVGSPCQDGVASSGVIVARSSGSGGSSPAVSTLCKFTAGPRAGQTQDYAPLAPLPVGSPCQDGKSSSGVIVPPH